jgi:hypothetical protein
MEPDEIVGDPVGALEGTERHAGAARRVEQRLQPHHRELRLLELAPQAILVGERHERIEVDERRPGPHERGLAHMDAANLRSLGRPDLLRASVGHGAAARRDHHVDLPEPGLGERREAALRAAEPLPITRREPIAIFDGMVWQTDLSGSASGSKLLLHQFSQSEMRSASGKGP